MTIEVFPSITTQSPDWRNKISEITQLGLISVCFFPTGINFIERQEAYKLLESSPVKKIPLVHLRHDMTPDEIRYLHDKYGTINFNIHSRSEGLFPRQYDLSEFKNWILVENTMSNAGTETNEWAGLCLDTAHMENTRRLHPNIYRQVVDDLSRFPVKATHISAIRKEAYRDMNENELHFDDHKYGELSDFDYLTYYLKYLPAICALELENSITEQLAAKVYIEKLING